MFTCKEVFNIKSHHALDFARLLGKFGMRFDMSDELFDVDYWTRTRYYYRTFIVYGTRKEMREFFDAVGLLTNYRI